MERVAFLLESGRRLGCMLNPESLTVTRNAGVQRRQTAGRPLTISGGNDDALLFTGGGTTIFHLDLLFDVSIAGSSVRADDVRTLTRPIHELAENSRHDRRHSYVRPPVATFIWGKAWNVTGVVTEVAERLESFTERGVATRSWLRMRFQRTAAERSNTTYVDDEPTLRNPSLITRAWSRDKRKPRATKVHQVLGGGATSGSAQRFDQIAAASLGSPSLWRAIADDNDILNPANVEVGSILTIPSTDGTLDAEPDGPEPPRAQVIRPDSENDSSPFACTCDTPPRNSE